MTSDICLSLFVILFYRILDNILKKENILILLYFVKLIINQITLLIILFTRSFPSMEHELKDWKRRQEDGNYA